MSGLPWPGDEYANWKDSGCALQPSCLSCPLERCIEEVPRGRQRQRMSDRAAAMAALRRQGSTAGQVAEAFGVSLRTVQRALQQHRGNGRRPVERRPRRGNGNGGGK